MVFEFAGLESPTSSDPAAARRYLLELEDAVLIERIVDWVHALRRDAKLAVADVAGLLQAPVAEVIASPFGLRACAIAAREGSALVRHELRALRPWHESLSGDDAVLDDEHGVWSGGRLRTGKYQSFLQDDPFSALNPGHIAKWTPHELLHRACAFVWRPGVSSWELYLGARLNELAPVALWYGPDQVLRLDEDAFDRKAPGRNPVDIDEALWLERSEAEIRAHAARTVGLLRDGIRHFEAELAAVRREIVTGRRERVPHEFLDASSDAVAYVAGHGTRLEDRAFARVFGAVLRPGREVFDDVVDYADFIEARFHELLFGTITVDMRLAQRRRDARRVRDWLQRAALCGWPAMRRLVPMLDELGTLVRRGMRGRPIDLALVRRQIAERLDADVASFVFADGFDTATLPDGSIAQLVAGFEATVPALSRSLGVGSLEAVFAFAASPVFDLREPLAVRFSRFLAHANDLARSELARFEHEIARDRRGDDDIERLCVREAFEGAIVVGSTAFDAVTFASDVVAWHAALSAGTDAVAEAGPVTYLVGRFAEDISVVPAPAPVIALFEALRSGPLPIDEAADLLAPLEEIDEPGMPAGVDGWLEELLGAGVIGCLPSLVRS